MRTKIVSIVVLATVTLVFNHCENETDQAQANTTGFDINTDAKVPTDMASRWMNRIDTRNARAENFTISKAAVSSSITGRNRGVALHHALDETGKHVLLAIAVGSDAKLWNSSFILNTVTGETFENTTAKKWATNYRQANPDKIRYHFFGIRIFESVNATLGFEYASLVPAINDKSEPQLLMLTWG